MGRFSFSTIEVDAYDQYEVDELLRRLEQIARVGLMSSDPAESRYCFEQIIHELGGSTSAMPYEPVKRPLNAMVNGYPVYMP
jgi:hypothetical protein